MMRYMQARLSRPALPKTKLLVGLAAVLVLGGLLVPRSKAKPPAIRQRIPSIATEQGLTGRTVIQLPAGMCVIYHVVPSTQPAAEPSRLAGDPDDESDDCTIVPGMDAFREYDGVPRHYHESVYNCVTYALGDSIGLKLNEWIEPHGSEGTFYSVPADVILQSYYDLIAEFETSVPIAQTQDACNQIVRSGDVVCFAAIEGDRRQNVHFAKTLSSTGKTDYVSKMGKGPLVRAPLKYYLREFEGQINRVRVYRKK